MYKLSSTVIIWAGFVHIFIIFCSFLFFVILMLLFVEVQEADGLQAEEDQPADREAAVSPSQAHLQHVISTAKKL